MSEQQGLDLAQHRHPGNIVGGIDIPVEIIPQIGKLHTSSPITIFLTLHPGAISRGQRKVPFKNCMDKPPKFTSFQFNTLPLDRAPERDALSSRQQADHTGSRRPLSPSCPRRAA
ncbi:hypothetical protein SCFA_250002 [anaerobic digester metagenome]|uniref:Uncharacterized protein n=1 Tax=anaerobic digester metagenome TaxID=1263854 RepID=A0A485LYQ5_9ZZZZ